VTHIVDSDQHLYESRSLWAEHIDPAAREDALSLVDDELGYTWLSWRGAHLGLAEPPSRRHRVLRGAPQASAGW
jgi:hypothetical protein